MGVPLIPAVLWAGQRAHSPAFAAQPLQDLQQSGQTGGGQQAHHVRAETAAGKGAASEQGDQEQDWVSNYGQIIWCGWQSIVPGDGLFLHELTTYVRTKQKHIQNHSYSYHNYIKPYPTMNGFFWSKGILSEFS